MLSETQGKLIDFGSEGVESFPTNIYLFKVKNRNIRKSEICSKLTIKTLALLHSPHSGVFIVNFEHISHPFLVFLLLTLDK